MVRSASGVMRQRQVPVAWPTSGGGPALDQRQGNALLDDLLFLIDELPPPADDAAAAARPGLLFHHFAADMDRVADEDRLAEVPLTDRQDRQGTHHRNGDAEAAAD